MAPSAPTTQRSKSPHSNPHTIAIQQVQQLLYGAQHRGLDTPALLGAGPSGSTPRACASSARATWAASTPTVPSCSWTGARTC